MKLKRIVSGALALALTACLAVPPVSAANSSFTDVSGGDAVNADILRLMGVVDGVGGNRFNPGGGLTRAQFCTMVVKFMQKGDEVATHATRTIFTDVTARHWALGYVNLAATLTVKDGEKETALVSGVGDGRFEPESAVTLAQAATILLRVLGYTSKQAGAVWPQSYLNLAASIGLTDGVSAQAGDALNRAQAARLFVNALKCKTGAGELYSKNLGTSADGVIILAVGVETDDGSSDGAIRTSNNENAEAYLAAAGEVKPAALVGKRGSLVLNDRDEIVTFVPDDSQSVTITLSGGAQPGYVKGTDGRQYTMSQDTLLYTSGSKGGTAWSEGYSGLYSGSQITMYSQRGKIVAVYAGGGSASDGGAGAVVVQGSPSAAMFHQLTGGAENYAIRKNRQSISMSEIKPYDVVTYDALSNTLTVSDLRLRCVYEDASPNAKAPTTITVLGHAFPVLDSAWDMTKDASLGNQVILLLTADGAVAGIAGTDSKLSSNAVGMVSSGGATLYLPSGGELKLTGTVSNAEDLADQLVVLSSASRGKLTAGRLSQQNAPGDFDVDGMKLGGSTVAAGVRLYERAGDSAMVQLDLSRLDLDRVPAGQIYTYHRNSSGMVDYIVLKEVTGDAYQYGLMTVERNTVDKTDLNGNTIGTKTETTWTLQRRTPVSFSTGVGYGGKNFSFAGVVAGQGLDPGKSTVIRASVELTGLQVRASDFFESQNEFYVSAGGRSYRIADNVECCYSTGSGVYGLNNWFTQESGRDRLNACKAASDDLTVYIDPIGSKVRVIAAN